MASGCIMGECWVCDELVWEDEWLVYNDLIIHEKCKRNAILQTRNIKNFNLTQAKKISEIQEDIEILKGIMSNCQDQIMRIEKMISNEKEQENKNGRIYGDEKEGQ